MAIIGLSYKYLERLTGADKDTILRRLPMIGSEIERTQADHADVEFFPTAPTSSRLKVWPGPCGAFWASRPACRIPGKTSGIAFTIDPKLASIRPFLGSAIIRDISFDDESILLIMALQEALHWAVGERTEQGGNRYP